MKNTNTAITKALKNAICFNHSGKMHDIVSLSTSVLLNKHCQERAKNPACICHYCYAAKLAKIRSTLEKKLARNTLLLSERIYSLEEIPFINALYFRFEAFGELFSEIQAANYLQYCKKNPGTNFALWTKNPEYIYNAIMNFNGGKKPKNLNIVYSSVTLNHCDAAILNRYILPNGKPMIDKVFTVYDAETIEKKNIQINCGSRDCMGCGLCYKKNKTVFVNEKLK